MAVAPGFCEAEVVTDVNFQLGDPPGTLQYFVGVTPITSAIVISNASTIGSIQADIDNDPVYQESGYTILITAGLPQVTAVITIASTTQIIFNAIGVFTGTHPDTGTGSFICNLIPVPASNRRRGITARRCPDEIYFKTANTDNKVLYCRQVYNFSETDSQGFRHYINSNSDISRRGSANWSVLLIRA